MKKATRGRKDKANTIRHAMGDDLMAEITTGILSEGKSILDSAITDIGRTLVEGILYMQREQIAGPDFMPTPGYIKGGSQQGSVFVGSQKLRIRYPRVQHEETGEVPLEAYTALKQRGAFSEELLAKSLRGLSGRRYDETIGDVADAFGVSKSSVSRHIVEATTQKLKEFQERDLSDIDLFAMYLDTIHRGGAAFVVALAVDMAGGKHVLGFWEGATENGEICSELFRDLKRRGLTIPEETLFVTDGGSGICKYLRDLFGERLMHQRCTIHKTRNIQRHLAKKYRKEVDRWFRRALNHASFEDAEGELKELYEWLVRINASAAASLKEAWDEILTLHRLQVADLLRKTLHSTNPIESMFATVRETELNIKRHRSSQMRQRWLATVLLHAEKRFKRVRGYAHIAEAREAIKRLQSRTEKKAA